jgi:hypothetical protein
MLEPSTETRDLAPLGQVAPSYVHRDKRLAPDQLLPLEGAWLKWYNLGYPEAPVAPDVLQLARAHLEQASRAGTLDVTGDLGFVILHRCNADFYFLIVSTWRNENELWQTIFAKDGPGQATFAPFLATRGGHRGTFCVWELGAVCHEQQAWRRFLQSDRGDADKRRYLGDVADRLT